MDNNTAKRFIKKNKGLYYFLYPLILIRRFFMNLRNNYLISVFGRFFAKVNGGVVLVSLPEFFGNFDIDVRSHIFRRIAMFNNYETNVRELIIQNLDPQRDAIDVGANIGLFTVLIAKKLIKGAKVLAIEPAPGALTLLQKNLRQNEVDDSVLVFKGVVSDRLGPAYINIAEGNEEYSTIGSSIVHESARDHQFTKIKVNGSTLDALVEKNKLNPGLIKIDVEGAEFLVLQGAQETLSKFKPIIIFEFANELTKNFSYTFTDITALFEKLNYRIIELDERDEYMAVPPHE